MRIALVGASKNLDNFDLETFQKLNLEIKYLVTNSTSHHYNKYKNKFNVKVINYKNFLSIDDYDIAYISTIESHRYDIIKHIIKTKDCICEKNFLLDEEKEIEIIKLSKIFNTRIYQCLITKYQKQYQTIKKNYFYKIGRIKHVNIYLLNPLNQTNNFRLSNYLSGGVVNDYLEYILDILQQISSEEIFDFKILNENTNKDIICTSVKFFFSYRSGLTAFVFASYDLNKRNECEIIGEKGSIKLYHPITFDRYTRIKITTEKNKVEKTISIFKNKILLFNKYLNQMYKQKNIILEEKKPIENMFENFKNKSLLINIQNNQLGFNNIKKFHEIKSKLYKYKQ